MTETDLILIYKRFEEIDRELKELREEVGQIKRNQNTFIKPIMVKLNGDIDHLDDKPLQRPNESYKDYLKRIGEYNEASAFEDDTK